MTERKRSGRTDHAVSGETVDQIVQITLSPPENAIVLSVDEKTSIQAIERTQLPLPLRQGRAARHNSSTYSTPAIARWLKKHPRIHFHYTPTSASWLTAHLRAVDE